jgi:hypothetical protein
MTYTEFILFLFYTKSGSPIAMWTRQSDTLKGIEANLITDYRTNSMSAIREQFGVFLDELDTCVLQPWQTAVTKIHSFAVQTGSKKAVEHLDTVVMNFLSEAQNGSEIQTPNFREWTNQVMNIIDADKEYYESRKMEGKKRGHVQDTRPKPEIKPSELSDVKTENVDVKKDEVNNITRVPGKCSVCSKNIMGPADREHPDRTYHSKCKECFKPKVNSRRQTWSKPVGQAVTEEDTHESEEGPIDCFNHCEFNEEKQCFMVNVDMSPNNKVKELTLQVITDKRPGHFVIDDGNVIDSGASVTLFNPDSKRLILPMIPVHPPVEIKGVGGKPFLVNKKCSAYMYYTDVSGKRHKFILSNVYVCSAVRVPQPVLLPPIATTAWSSQIRSQCSNKSVAPPIPTTQFDPSPSMALSLTEDICMPLTPTNALPQLVTRVQAFLQTNARGRWTHSHGRNAKRLHADHLDRIWPLLCRHQARPVRASCLP